MNLTDRLTLTRSRSWPPRRTVRLRLTLLYSFLFLAAGTVLLTITYILVRSAPSGKVANPLLPSPPTPGSKPLAKPTPSGLALTQMQLKAQALATHATDMHELLIMSGIALAIMAVLAIALGWLVAERTRR